MALHLAAIAVGLAVFACAAHVVGDPRAAKHLFVGAAISAAVALLMLLPFSYS